MVTVYCWVTSVVLLCVCVGDLVRVLLNEEPIRFPICNENEFCELNVFVDGCSKLTEHWRTFQDICS